MAGKSGGLALFRTQVTDYRRSHLPSRRASAVRPHRIYIGDGFFRRSLLFIQDAIMVATPNKPSAAGESSNATLWQRYEDWLYYHEGLGLYLDISRMGFDDALVNSLKPRFDKAFQDMAALEGGAIANPDENRMVGHYWLRDPDLAPAELKSEIVTTLNDIEAFVNQVHAGTVKPAEAERFTDILSVGIGGSALGPEFVAEALSPDQPPHADPLHRQHRSGGH